MVIGLNGPHSDLCELVERAVGRDGGMKGEEGMIYIQVRH